MKSWKTRVAGFAIGFAIGLALVAIYTFIAGFFATREAQSVTTLTRSRCVPEDFFATPEDVVAALKSEDVGVRREAFRRLFLRPSVSTIYYDYERDRDYPERAERAHLQYVKLDEASDMEAIVTFVRYESPVALILKKDVCGWHNIAALGAWLRFEDYPYENWIELPETVKRGTHEILVHESTGDASYYVRKARLLRLKDDALVSLAEWTEETIKPIDDYKAADWSDVKTHETRRATFATDAEGEARLRIETMDEIVKYRGIALAYAYWRETDGAWHASRKHWRARDAVRLKLNGQRTQELRWDEQKQRFVDERR